MGIYERGDDRVWIVVFDKQFPNFALDGKDPATPFANTTSAKTARVAVEALERTLHFLGMTSTMVEHPSPQILPCCTPPKREKLEVSLPCGRCSMPLG